MNIALIQFKERAADMDVTRLRRWWRWTLGVFVLSVALRLLEYDLWDYPQLWLDTAAGTEPVLATHDAYYWLAAAAGVRPGYLSILPKFSAFCIALLHVTPGQFAFWAPAFLGALVAPVTCLWGQLLSGKWTGAIAGMLVSFIPGYFLRTRLGYYDTDVFTLLMPLVVGLLLAVLVSFIIKADTDETRTYSKYYVMLAIVFGLFSRTAWWWHQDIYRIVMVLHAVALVMLLLFTRGRLLRRGLLALTAFALAAMFGGPDFYWPLRRVFFNLALLSGKSGWPAMYLAWAFEACFGVLLAAVIAILDASKQERLQRVLGNIWVVLAGLAVVLAVTSAGSVLTLITDRLAAYWGGGTAASVTTGTTLFPGVVQSIIEAKNVEWANILSRLGPNALLAVLALPGFVWLCFKRPMAVFLAPLLVVSLLSYKLGIRFTMFGAPATALGLGFLLSGAVQYGVDRFKAPGWARVACQVALGLLLMAPLWAKYSDVKITPVIAKPYVQALQQLGSQVEPDARVWGWWDYGYATQYYAKAKTVTDGGNHDGKVIYPEALALTTDSFRLTSQVMKYSAQHDYNPYRQWETMPAAEVKALLERMKMEEVVQGDVPPQYIAVPWETLNIMGWITFYGGWDVETGESVKHPGKRIRDFRFDPKGAVVFRDGKAVKVSSVDVLDGGPRKNKYFSGQGPHLVINAERKEGYLLDDQAYDSVLVQLMVGDPRDGLVGKYFDIVVDGSPSVRIYRLK